MGNLFTARLGNILTVPLGNVLTAGVGKVLDIYMGSRYGGERLEAACERALRFDLVSFRGVRNILENGLDKVKTEETPSRPEKPHGNLRGGRYYS